MTDQIVTLSPVQQRTLEVLRRSGDPVVFDVEFIDDIRAEMRAAIDHFAERLDPDEEIWISKHRIASVLECETNHLLPDEFEWTSANAKGTIAHKAIELQISWPTRLGEPAPVDLVDQAMVRLADENRSIGQWIETLSPADEADVRGQTSVRVTQFVENFPPLSKRWAPVTEASVRWPNTGPITLAGKVDLLFGRPNARESRKVIIDLKTGRPSPRHRQDLAFYALLETLVREVPPRKVATFYLDAAEAQADDVSERLIETAMRRTLDGIHRLIEVESEGRPPTRRPGVTCRWCPINTTCDDGVAYLRAQGRDD
ncbi:PD-(D/E)XK nuclease family protein [Ilumatobacter sp.]|uniref:PD-(D/E)XK nuclease family protein n=1 Tax=Ilumatobacter sp. TaxID=1967498 RepID=UPI003C33C22B